MSSQPPRATEWASACVAVSGSVAAVKAPDLASALLSAGVSVDLVLTEAAHSLLQSAYQNRQPWAALQALAAAHAPPIDAVDANASTLEPPKRFKKGDVRSSATAAAAAAAGSMADPYQGGSSTAAAAAADAAVDQPQGERLATLRIHHDADEWRGYNTVGTDPVLHVELAKRNSLLLVAPLCANTLAQAALGLCGNLLGSVLRAWYYDLDADFATPLAERYGAHCVNKPVLVAPAMNTFMWHQKITGTHLQTLEARGVTVVPPISKLLACGDVGVGAMAEVRDVAAAALAALRAHVAAETRALGAEGKPKFRP